MIVEALPWIGQAACRGLNPELFHVDRGEPTRHAKAICGACPVAGDCLEWAIATGQKQGIWGGKSPRERLWIGRQRGLPDRPLQPCGTYAAYRRGCHCDACVVAQRAYHRQHRHALEAGHSTPDWLWTIALVVFIIFLLDRLGVFR